MRGGKLVRWYAQALAEPAAERGLLESIVAGAQLVGEVLQQEPSLVWALADERVPLEERLSRLRELFGDRLPPLFHHFFRLVLTKGRTPILPEICTEIPHAADRLQGVVEADVTVAKPLPEDQQEALRLRLEELTGQTVRLVVQEDPSLLGGVVVRMGDLVLDGSVATRLKRLEAQLRN